MGEPAGGAPSSWSPRRPRLGMDPGAYDARRLEVDWPAPPCRQRLLSAGQSRQPPNPVPAAASRAEGTEVRWHSAFDAPPGVGWIYVAALRRSTGRLLAGLSRRLRDRATIAP